MRVKLRSCLSGLGAAACLYDGGETAVFTLGTSDYVGTSFTKSANQLI